MSKLIVGQIFLDDPNSIVSKSVVGEIFGGLTLVETDLTHVRRDGAPPVGRAGNHSVDVNPCSVFVVDLLAVSDATHSVVTIVIVIRTVNHNRHLRVVGNWRRLQLVPPSTHDVIGSLVVY